MTTRATKAYTAQELRKFDSLTLALSSQSQMGRINARFAIRDFEKEHGKAKCEAMFAVLKARDEARRKKAHD